MKQNQTSKIIAIIALCIAVVGITLGFAAFSNTLTISSSATVSPDKSDFKLEIYGISQDLSDLENSDALNIINDANSYGSTDNATARCFNGAKASSAIIDNEKLTISNLKAEFTEPGQQARYYFIVKNIGEYDAYVKVSDLLNLSARAKGQCAAGEGTDPELVDATCSSIYITGSSKTSDFNNIAQAGGSYLIEKGDFLFFDVYIIYNETTNRADGPFTVKFDDIKLNFSTAA